MGSSFRCARRWTDGPGVAAFFKISCPTCQYAFPFLQRIYEAHGNSRITVVGISQNEKKDYCRIHEAIWGNFPVLLDDTRTYPVSNEYGLTNVPSVFWIAEDGEIEISSVGWVRKEMEEINQRASAISDAAPSRFSLEMSRSPIFVLVEGRKLAAVAGENFLILSSQRNS